MDTLGKRLCYIIVVTLCVGLVSPALAQETPFSFGVMPQRTPTLSTILESHSQLYQHAEWCTPTAQAEQDTPRTRSDDPAW